MSNQQDASEQVSQSIISHLNDLIDLEIKPDLIRATLNAIQDLETRINELKEINRDLRFSIAIELGVECKGNDCAIFNIRDRVRRLRKIESEAIALANLEFNEEHAKAVLQHNSDTSFSQEDIELVLEDLRAVQVIIRDFLPSITVKQR